MIYCSFKIVNLSSVLFQGIATLLKASVDGKIIYSLVTSQQPLQHKHRDKLAGLIINELIQRESMKLAH